MYDEKLANRFWWKVLITDAQSCWPFMGAISSNGYGSFAIDKTKKKSAHVVAYELFYGPTTPGLDVMHSCDNRSCCNPSHLSEGTRRENLNQARERGRMIDFGGIKPDNRGEKQGHATLTDAQAKEVWSLRENGTSQREIGELYGVDRRVIGRIWNQQTWRHLHES